jgi:hypothetical protein
MTNVMKYADVRVRKFGNSFGFSFQSLLQRTVGRKARRQDLDRNVAIEARVPRAVHLTHAART